jgi:hypothetical protein
VGDCDKQNCECVERRVVGERGASADDVNLVAACKSAAQQQPSKAFPPPVFVSSTAEFDFFCDT